MYGIAIQNIAPDCEQEIKFSCKETTRLFIDDGNKSINIDPGNHCVKIKRHHDFFFDWIIDGEVVDEFLVYQLVSNEESSIIIQSEEEINIFDKKSAKDIVVESNTSFPFITDLLDTCQISIVCNKTSQLSIYFQNDQDCENREDCYKTITLVFNDEYCKVYLDEYKNKEYLPDSRKNLSLFNTKIGINNIIRFSKENHTMKVYNSEVKMKEYNIEGVFEKYPYLCIEESYTPNGAGKYLINNITN